MTEFGLAMQKNEKGSWRCPFEFDVLLIWCPEEDSNLHSVATAWT